MLEVLAIVLYSQQPIAPVEEGVASYYTAASSSLLTASGETMDDSAFTCAMLKKIEHKDGAAVKQSFLYALDDVGNIVKTTQEDGSVWEYTYDNRYRLITAVRAEEDTFPEIEAKYIYTYDDADNMLTKVEPFRDDFNDKNYTGWTLTGGGTWSASNGYLSDTTVGAAYDYAWETDFSDEDTEIAFSYRRTSDEAGMTIDGTSSQSAITNISNILKY